MKHLLKVAALVLLTLAPTAALADAWDNLNNYLRAETGVADFTLTKSEFGNNNFQVFFHAGLEYVAAVKNGYLLLYTPADPGSPINFGDAGPGYSEPTMTGASLKACGPGHWFIQDVGGAIWCTPAHLVGKSGGSYLISDAVAPTPRECSVQVIGVNHEHSC